MIALREDGFESFRYKLRTLSDRELIHFGRQLRQNCLKPNDDPCWKQLQLAREEWRSRHPRPPRRRR